MNKILDPLLIKALEQMEIPPELFQIEAAQRVKYIAAVGGLLVFEYFKRRIPETATEEYNNELNQLNAELVQFIAENKHLLP